MNTVRFRRKSRWRRWPGARAPQPARFRGAPRRRRWWRGLAMLVLLAGVLGASWLSTRWNAQQGPWEQLPARVGECGVGRGWQACAIDGDTIAIAARGGAPARRVRLYGFDAPELDGACPAERSRALLARAELSRWLSAGPVTLDGGTDPPRDRYGRELRRARRTSPGSGSEWLDDHMVAAGLAHREGPGRAGGWC